MAMGAVTGAAGALKDTAIESARNGIRNVSEKIGKVAGAGMAVAATTAVEAAGYHPSPLIAVGAGYAGMKMGGLVGKAMHAGLDRVSKGGGGPIVGVMAQLSEVLQLLDEVGPGIATVIDSVNKTQACFQRVSKGANNNLLDGATEKCRAAPSHFNAGMGEIKAAEVLVEKHLVTVARAGKS